MKTNNKINPTSINYSSLKVVKECLLEKAQAINRLIENIDTNTNEAINAILECSGRIIISGMGKSGIIGKKFAATLASTGTPSFFIHPSEALHGDLGMICNNDLVLFISNSGETEEVLKLVPSLKNFGNKIIAIVNSPESTLAKDVDISLNIHVKKEVCPNNLAPTTSTTVTLALADSISVALMEKRKFRAEEFALFHPGGSLGRRLLTTVKDLMRKENFPFVSLSSSLSEVLLIMTEKKVGIAIVTDKNKIKGVISDGDIRRSLLKNKDIYSILAEDIMTNSPITIDKNSTLNNAKIVFKKNKVNNLLIKNSKDELLGIIENNSLF